MLSGKFSHEKNEGLKEFLIANDISVAFAEKSDAIKSTIDVSQNGNTFTIATEYPDKKVSITFTIGQEFDDPVASGEILKSVASLAGNTISVKSKKEGKEIGSRDYEFSDSHCVIVMHSTSSDKVAKRYFKRV